jgi:hypothetical protein
MTHFNHFMPGTMVYVTFDLASPNRLRAMPRIDAAVVGRLPPRSVVEVLGGPAYHNGHIFWQIRAPVSGQVGWTSQGTDSELYLRPVIEHVVCPGAPTSLLQPNDRAMAALKPADPAIVRRGPGQACPLVGEIPPGGLLTILDGPACLNGFVWWEIHADSGVQGWTPEGEPTLRWLLPIEVGYS